MTLDSDQDRSDDTEPVLAHDQTNGLAGDLEGDDGGAEPETDEHRSLLGGLLAQGLDVTHNHGDSTSAADEGDEGYSEEGRA
jgi:hypothetical protein